MSNVIAALFVGMIGAAVVGVLVGVIALRRTGIYFAMITVAIAETFFFIENNPLSAWTGGENGIPGVPTPELRIGGFSYHVRTGWSMYGFLAVCYFVGIVIALRIVRSPVGAVFSAIRDNPLRARAVGHAVGRYKLTAFVIAAAYAGFAGGLLGVLQAFMPPEAFTFGTSGQLVMQTAIGGSGTLFGPLVGAAVWLFLRDFLQGPLGLGSAWKLVLGPHLRVAGLLPAARPDRRAARISSRSSPLGGSRPAPEERRARLAAAPLASVGPSRRRQETAAAPGAGHRGERHHQIASAASSPTATSISPSSRASCAASSAPTARARARSSRCSPARWRRLSGRIIFHGRDITGMDVAACASSA